MVHAKLFKASQKTTLVEQISLESEDDVHLLSKAVLRPGFLNVMSTIPRALFA